MVSHRSLSDSKSPQVSWTLFIILANLNNAIALMVSTCPLISKSPTSLINHMVTVPYAPITIGITVTFMFHSFFSSLARSRFLSFVLLSFSFTQWSARMATFTIQQVLFFLLVWSRL